MLAQDKTRTAEALNPVLAYRQRLIGYLLHLIGDPSEAEDIYQELTEIVLRRPDMLTRAGDVFAYLRGVARHLAAGRHSYRVRTGEVLRRWTEWAWEADSGTVSKDGSSEEERQRQVEALRKCRDELKPGARQLISLRYDQGLEIKGVAAALGSSVGAVKVSLLRLRRLLAGCVRSRLAAKGGGS